MQDTQISLFFRCKTICSTFEHADAATYNPLCSLAGYIFVRGGEVTRPHPHSGCICGILKHNSNHSSFFLIAGQYEF